MTARNPIFYGASRVMVPYAIALREHGFDVTVAHGPIPAGSAADVETIVAKLEAADVRTRLAPALAKPRFPGSRARLRQLIQELRPDLVVGSQLRDIAAIVPAAAQLQIPTIALVLNLPRFNGYHWLRRIKRNVFGNTVRRQATHVVACAPAIRDELITDFSVDPEKISVILNALDFGPRETNLAAHRESVRKEFHVAEGRPLWINVARLHEQKGQDILLESLVLLRQSGVSPMPLLLLVGDPDGKLGLKFAERLQQFITTNDLRDIVHLTGFRKDCRRLVSGSDLFILPSRWEGLPIAVLEAFEAQCPVVMAQYGGRFDNFNDGKDGLYCRPNDPQDLAAALTRILNLTDDKRREMGRCGREFLEQNVSLAAVQRQFVGLVEHLLKQSSSHVSTHSHLQESQQEV